MCRVVLPDTAIHRLLSRLQVAEETAFTAENISYLSSCEKLAYYIAINHEADIWQCLHGTLKRAEQENMRDLRELNFPVSLALDLKNLRNFNGKLYDCTPWQYRLAICILICFRRVG
jgi:hypothetical protein